MKSLFRRLIFTTITLFIISRLFPQVSFANIGVLISTGIVLVLLTVFVKPFLKILFLPVNLITFGLFSWVINIIVIYLAVLLVPGFHIHAITIPSFTLGIFIFPPFHLSQFWSLFFVSFLVSLGGGLFSWIL
jgi:putative membrane protein